MNNCGCTITTPCELHKESKVLLFECKKCEAVFPKNEIQIKYEYGSNICDRDKKFHCPKCDSQEIYE